MSWLVGECIPCTTLFPHLVANIFQEILVGPNFTIQPTRALCEVILNMSEKNIASDKFRTLVALAPKRSVSILSVTHQNRHQKFFKEGFTFVQAGGFDTVNIDKTPLIYSVSYFNLGGDLVHCLGGLAHRNPPVATGLSHTLTSQCSKIHTPQLCGIKAARGL